MSKLENLKKQLDNPQVKNYLLKAKFGLEKENVRVDQEGRLALTPHPAKLGDKNEHPYITTDFSESQVEMVTPPLPSINELHGFMETIHDIVTEYIGDELLWPQSLPPLLPDESKIPIAKFGPKGREKETYRELLARVYGKERQLISGVHFNFSFGDDMINGLKESLNNKDDFETFKEAIYFKLSRNIMRYRWLLIWLFGKSPKAEDSFKVKSLTTGYYESVNCYHGISLRNCRSGYRNKEDYFIDFTNTDSYKSSIQHLVDTEKLSFGKELYNPVRIKYDEESQLISHIELRLLDLDPMEKIGISKTSLYFTHLFLIYCLFLEEEYDFSAENQLIANSNHDRVACGGRDPELMIKCFSGVEMNARDQVLRVVKKMISFSEENDLLSKPYKDAMDSILNFVNTPEERVANKLLKEINEQGFLDFHLKKAQLYRKESLAKDFRFHGLEDMELSSQLILKEAVRRGLLINILDKRENFISISNGEKIEYIQQATKTSIDAYSSVLLMGNKHITKSLLIENEINTPSGNQYTNILKAKADFGIFQNQGIVIKPNSTNFGIGITILKQNIDQQLYNRALEIAFENEDTVLIEYFFDGDEYRFFVIGNKVEAILKRIPANVIGDGSSSIRELVKIKNKDPIRGRGYRTPLEKIKLEEAESIFLKTQHLNFDSIPSKDEQIFLRENSNISTGGDSIDFTDEIHQSYKDIAIKAAKALKVEITGLDMMIKDITLPASKDNYTIIELNFNPAIHIHCYPYKGKNRRLNEKILDAIGF